MKEKNKKTIFLMVGVILLFLITIGITYAYWLVTRTQTGKNMITPACLDISLDNEKNDINLTEQFPISDEKGKELVPYEFTITNNCDNDISYQIAMESLGDKSNAISSNAIKVNLDDDLLDTLNNSVSIDTTMSNAYESHVLGMSKLVPNESVTHELRIWIDQDATIDEMNKTFTSKINITGGQFEVTYDSIDEYILATKYNAKVGDYVNYDPVTGAETLSYVSLKDKNGYGDQTFNLSDYTSSWQVLGVEDSKLALISTDIVEPTSGGESTVNDNWQYYYLSGEKGFAYGIDELNSISSLYGQGDYADSARSVTMEDLMDVSLGFNTDLKYCKQYGETAGPIGAYGLEVTYGLENDKLVYTGSDGSSMTADPNYFYYYDETTKSFLTYNDIATQTPQQKYKLTNSLTDYYPIRYYEDKGMTLTQLANKGVIWFDLLYKNSRSATASKVSEQQPYWIAFRRYYANINGYTSYGLYYTSSFGVISSSFTKSTEEAGVIDDSSHYKGIRPVVILNKDVKLEYVSSKVVNIDTYSLNVFNIVNELKGNIVDSNNNKVQGKILSTKDKVEVFDSLGNKIVVPPNFKITHNADLVEDGIVITDSVNEFVWIPVGDIKISDGTTKNISLDRYSFNVNSGVARSIGSTAFVYKSRSYAEKTESDLVKIANNLEQFIEATNANGGYYIARYEARKINTSDLIINKDYDIYNRVSQNKAAELSKELYKTKTFVSDLTNSYAWDTAVVFIQTVADSDYSIKTSIIDTINNRGTVDLEISDVECNIYDMASNAYEWTTEAAVDDEDHVVSRGGLAGNIYYTPRFRNSYKYNSSSSSSTFRPILYFNY